jgi:HD-like signal output (HDOD) protein
MKSLISNFFTKTPEINTDNVSEKRPMEKSATTSYQKQPTTILKKLAPLRDLSDAELDDIDQNVLLYKAESIIFEYGKSSEHIYYLIEGSVQLESNGGGSYSIDEGSLLANLPINSGRTFGATAITKSPSVILLIPASVITWWGCKTRTNNKGTLEVIDFSLPKGIPNTPFFNQFFQAHRDHKLSFPALPQVAIQLRKAMEKDIGIADAAKIVQIDALIVVRLIQLANSALYAGSSPAKNCHDAVARLGLDLTRKLVMSIGVKHLFSCKSPQLMLKMQMLWKKSLFISSLSFVLAQESGEVNPEDALLAGLVCDIGSIPLIHFAEHHQEICPNLDKLQDVMPLLNAVIGSDLLETLGFSDEFIEIPNHAENWYYESGKDDLTLLDIVILAKFHSYLGTPRAKDLPYINSIPAYTKVKNGKLNADFSLDILAKGKQKVDDTMRIFA